MYTSRAPMVPSSTGPSTTTTMLVASIGTLPKSGLSWPHRTQGVLNRGCGHFRRVWCPRYWGHRKATASLLSLVQAVAITGDVQRESRSFHRGTERIPGCLATCHRARIAAIRNDRLGNEWDE